MSINGFEGASRFQATSLETLVRLASSGVGVTLLPEMAVASYSKDVAVNGSEILSQHGSLVSRGDELLCVSCVAKKS